MILILAICAVTAFTLVGAWYARRYGRPDGLIALYVLFTTLTQILAAKIATFDFGFIQVQAPAAMIIFPVTFLITDVVNEKFGRREVYRMIFVTLVTQIAMMAFLLISGRLPPAPFWENQDAWDRLLGVVPRITVASWITFVLSENLDAWLFHWFRQRTKGKHLWARNVFSTVPALTVDTVVFVTLAFAGGALPLWTLMKGQFVSKYIVAILCIPFMYLNRAVLGGDKDIATVEPR